MSHHLPSSVERLIRRHGSTITVRRTTGALDPVTSTRAAGTSDVQTLAYRHKHKQESAKGDPLSSAHAWYLVPAKPFEGMFTPQDGDLLLDGDLEGRVMKAEPKDDAGVIYAYDLYVGGVAA